jgi:hypothetical protein
MGEPELDLNVEELDRIVAMSTTIFGWRDGQALREIAVASWGLGIDPIIVEIGAFMGRSSVVLAGARQLRGSGRIHCVDPFDCSGDAFSIPHYVEALNAAGSNLLEEVFRRNITRLGVASWIEVHRGTARDVGRRWSSRIDLLMLDADQSVEGAREAYDTWVPFLVEGGTIVVGNVHPNFCDGHAGNSLLVAEELKPPRFSSVRRVGSTVFATKVF